VRGGLRFYWTDKIYTETYAIARYGRDLNRDFWNNRFEWGGGLRTRFFKKVFLAIYMEGIFGRYLDIPEEYPQPTRTDYKDFRSGLILWYGWDTWYNPKRFISIPLIHWGEIYSEVNYFHRENKTVFGSLHARAGFHLIRFWKADIDVYGVTYMMKDINKDFWNNKAEVGPGLWIKPWSALSLKFYIEWLWGTYFGIEGKDANPYAQHYTDRKMGILCWIGL
jgi:hypothetical protein